MSGRGIVAVAGAIVFSLTCVTASEGLELKWSTGASEINFSGVMRCTLLVRASTPGDALPNEWHLGYIFDGGPGPVIEADGEAADEVGVCSVGRLTGIGGMIGHEVVADHCVHLGTARASIARYILRFESAVRGRIGIYEPQGDSGHSPAAEVTVNGGTAGRYPPLITQVNRSRNGDNISLTVKGYGLDQVQGIEFWSGSGRRECVFVVDVRDSIIVAHGRYSPLFPAGALAVLTADGMASTRDMDAEPMPPTREYAPGRVIVRFADGEVDPPSGATEAAVSEFAFRTRALRTNLATVGVVKLRRLLPWFKHGDVRGTNLRGEPITLDDLANLYLAYVDSSADVPVIAAAIRRMPGVLYAHPDVRVSGMAVPPNDALYGQQWGLHGPVTVCGLNTAASIFAEQAWNITMGSSQTRIGILDSGIDPFHPDLNGRVDEGVNFVEGQAPEDWYDDTDPVRHGTAVAGLAAAKSDNSMGVAGVDWFARLVPIKVLRLNQLTQKVEGNLSWFTQGIDWARDHGIPILNMSLGTLPNVSYPIDEINSLNDACRQAFLTGQLLVAASGNLPWANGGENPQPIYPAANRLRVLAVGAILPNNLRWIDFNLVTFPCTNPPFEPNCFTSNYGPWLDVVAPGGRMIATTRGGSAGDYYDLSACSLSDPATMGFSGTSAAAPIVSGVAGLLRGFRPELVGEDLEQLLKLGGDKASTPTNPEYGYGRVVAISSLNLVTSPNVIAHWSMGTGLPFSIGPLTVQSASDSAEVAVKFRSVDGITSDVTLVCERYRLHGTGTFKWPFMGTPKIWARGASSNGARDSSTIDRNYEIPFGRIIAGSVSNASVSVETFCYRVPGYANAWYPVHPSKVHVGLTVIGRPATNTAVEGVTEDATAWIRAFPNPMVRSVSFRLHVPVRSWVRGRIVDVEGRQIVSIINGEFSAGEHELRWDGRTETGKTAAAGVYFIQMELEGERLARRFVVMGKAAE